MRYNQTTHIDPRKMPEDTGLSIGWHRHHCKRCGIEWAHDGAKLDYAPDAKVVKAHTCPCGNEVWWCE